MSETTTAIPICPVACAMTSTEDLEYALRHVPGVHGVDVPPDGDMAYVEYDADACDMAHLRAVIEDAGFAVPRTPRGLRA